MQDSTEYHHYLRTKISSLVTVDAKTLDAILAFFELKKIPKDTLLLGEGDRCDFWGFVYSGLIRVFTYADTGEEYTNGFAGEDSFITESSSFFSQCATLENFMALEDTVMIYVTYKSLQQLFVQFPEFEKFARILYERRLNEMKKRMLQRIHFNAQTRYKYLVDNQAQLAVRVPLKYIASYLSITDSTLSRIRRKLMKGGH